MKTELTLCIMQEQGIGEDRVKQIKQQIWVDPYSKTGLRLTKDGVKFMLTADMKSYTIQLLESAKITSKVVLQLSKVLKGPYFYDFHLHTLTLFSEDDAVALTLYDNDLIQFISDNDL